VYSKSKKQKGKTKTPALDEQCKRVGGGKRPGVDEAGGAVGEKVISSQREIFTN
jgi:hypothetical protein